MTTALTTTPSRTARPIIAAPPGPEAVDIARLLAAAYPLADRPPRVDIDAPVPDIEELVTDSGLGTRLRGLHRHVGPDGIALPDLVHELDHGPKGVRPEQRRWLTACTIHAATLSGHIVYRIEDRVTRVVRGPTFSTCPDKPGPAITDPAAAVHIGARLVSSDPLSLQPSAPPAVSCRQLPLRFLEAFVGRESLDLRGVRASLARDLRAALGSRVRTTWLDDELARLVLLFVDLGWCRVVRTRKVHQPLIAATPLALFGFALLLIEERQA